ncbi:ankyrin repeat protein, partial [Tribonema minus]
LQDHGLTALHYAVFNGNTLCVEVLCANASGHDANGHHCSCIDMVSTMGCTALHLAAAEASNAAAIIEILLSSGADAAIRDGQGRTAADVAAEKGRHQYAEVLS